jgi:hypothetical protein
MAMEAKQAELLAKIFESSNGLATYSLFIRLMWSPATLALELSKAQRGNFVSLKDGRYLLTEVGLQAVLSSRIKVGYALSGLSAQSPSKSKGRGWINRGEILGVNMPYVPRLSAKR